MVGASFALNCYTLYPNSVDAGAAGYAICQVNGLAMPMPRGRNAGCDLGQNAGMAGDGSWGQARSVELGGALIPPPSFTARENPLHALM